MGKTYSDQLGIEFVDIDEKIFLHSAPIEIINNIEVIKGESADFNMVVKSTDIKFVKIRTVSQSLLPFIQINRISYVPSVINVRENHDDYCFDKEHLFPDPLVKPDLNNITLSPGINNQFCISILPCIDDFEEQDLTVEFYSEEDILIAQKTIIVRQLGIELPKHDLIYSNWFHYDSIINYYNVNTFSDDFFEILSSFIDLAVTSGQNTIYVPLFTPPLDTQIGGERVTTQLLDIEKKEGEYHFNFDLLERFIDFAAQRGMEYFEFSHLFTQWGAKAAPKIMVSENARQKREFGWDTPSTDPKYIEFLTKMLSKLKTFLLKKNIADKCFFHISDEPKVEDKELYDRCFKLVSGVLGSEFKIIDAISHYDFYREKIVTNPVVQLYNAEEFKTRGVEKLYIYYCWEHYKHYVTNRLMSMPMQRTRVLGIQLYLNDVRMFLHWGFNFYNDFLSLNAIDPYCVTDAGGVLPSGDTFIVYPDKKNKCAIPSIRLIAMKECFRDYRLLKKLESLTSKEYVSELLRGFGFEGFSKYPRSLTEHKKVIDNVIKSILKANKKLAV